MPDLGLLIWALLLFALFAAVSIGAFIGGALLSFFVPVNLGGLALVSVACGALSAVVLAAVYRP